MTIELVGVFTKLNNLFVKHIELLASFTEFSGDVAKKIETQ